MGIIQCSSAPIIESLNDIKRRGFCSTEVHLMSSDTNGLAEMYKELGLDVWSVHTPIIGDSELNLHEVADSRIMDMFVDTCNLAESLAADLGHVIYVIVHNIMPVSYWSSLDSSLSKSKLGWFVPRLKNVKICIENVTPMSNKGELVNGLFTSDIREICGILNKSCKCERFGICFDLCHFLTTKQFFADALQHSLCAEKYKGYGIGIYESVRDAGELLWNVHVADVYGLGDTKETHAYQITEDRKENLFQLVCSVDEFCDPVWTIEVREDDYNVRTNAEITKDVLVKLLEEL